VALWIPLALFLIWVTMFTGLAIMAIDREAELLPTDLEAAHA
jgi:hypothetical protein